MLLINVALTCQKYI